VRGCSVPKCENKHVAKGYCTKHYNRLRRGMVVHLPSKLEMSLEERFLSHVDKTDTCWFWTASKFAYKAKTFKEGYGRFTLNGPDGKSKSVLAHRWSYGNFVAPIPLGLVINHLCETPACVNPEHLEVCTTLENNVYSIPSICKRGHDRGTGRCKECDYIMRIKRRDYTNMRQRMRRAKAKEEGREYG